MVANDEVVITVRVEKEGKRAADVRQYVNRVSGSISRLLEKEQARAKKAMSFKTISRSMQPVWHYPKQGKRVRTGWKMVQTSEISSKRLGAVPEWLDAVEKVGAHLSRLAFRVSLPLRQRVQRELLTQAVAAFRNKAVVMATAMNAASYRIIRLDTASARAPAPRVYRGEMAMMAKSSGAPQPSLSAGENRISVAVSGEIELPFIDFSVR